MKKLPSDDYVMTENSIWVTVENLSVYIHKTDEGVVVDIYPVGQEMDNSIVSTYAFFNEGVSSDDDEEEDETISRR